MAAVQALFQELAIPSDPDLWFTLGLVIVVLMIPSLFSAYVDGRVPRASSTTVLIAVGMITYAGFNKPEGYELGEIPEVFTETISRYLR